MNNWKRDKNNANKYFGEYKMANAQTNRKKSEKCITMDEKNAASTEQTSVKMETESALRCQCAITGDTIAEWQSRGKTDNMLAYNAKNFFV